jgi:hypothetical protein
LLALLRLKETSKVNFLAKIITFFALFQKLDARGVFLDAKEFSQVLLRSDEPFDLLLFLSILASLSIFPD